MTIVKVKENRVVEILFLQPFTASSLVYPEDTEKIAGRFVFLLRTHFRT